MSQQNGKIPSFCKVFLDNLVFVFNVYRVLYSLPLFDFSCLFKDRNRTKLGGMPVVSALERIGSLQLRSLGHQPGQHSKTSS
jgi:hypothetical protein